MPPKASVANGEGADAVTFKFIFSVLKHCESIKPNWDEVAKENGIGYARNASSKFATIVKKHGLEFRNYAICDPADEGTAAVTGDEVKTPKKKATPRKRKSEDGHASTASTPGKKKKSAPFIIKEDDDDETPETKVKDEEDALSQAKSEMDAPEG